MNLQKSVTKLDDKSHGAIQARVLDEVIGHVSKADPSVSRPPKPSAQAVHQKTQRPKTLMRDIVRRPQPVKKTLPTSAKQLFAPILPTGLSDERLNRAKSISQSKLVSRFNDFGGRSNLVKKTEHVAVKSAPVEAISHHISPPILTSLGSITTSRLFASAVDNASSHTEKPKAKTRRHAKIANKLGISSRILAISTASLSAVLIVGFFAYQKAPNVSFRLAASQAGVRASLPSYKPAGFALKGPVQSAPGQITVRYQSNSDSRGFTVTQKSSNWNSSALLDNFVATNRRNYQTLQDNGKTIYIYDDTNATWVDGGVWYQIEGDSNLSSDQLLHIANSM